ncbi:MAG: hypothetical protein IJG59_06050 [Erysipelotrichaceae bacterium]|nr:hypothetical protein [Erysipelotrichaceae bacterium]
MPLYSITYSIILIAVAIVLALIAVRINKGHTNLIINYHQSRVKPEEKMRYARDFSKGIFCLSGTLLIAGIIALITKILIADIILVAGIIISIVILVRVQNRYNKGLF